MIFPLKRLYFILSWIWILCSLAFLLFGYVKREQPMIHEEAFTRQLTQLNTLEELDQRVKATFEHSHQDTVYIAHFIDSLLKKRFYHGYSEVQPDENWMAWLAGKLFWQDFLFHTTPKKIIQYPMAACSQQGILFQDQLQKLGIRFATTAMTKNKDLNSGHYAVSVWYKGGWHFYDTNLEAEFDSLEHPSYQEMIQHKTYKKAYEKKYNQHAQSFFKNKSIKRVDINVIKGTKMAAFHLVTEYLSKYLWVLLLSINLWIRFRKVN